KPSDTPYANIIQQHNHGAFKKAMKEAVIELWTDDNAQVAHFIATVGTLLEKEEDQRFLKELAFLFFQKMTKEQKQIFVASPETDGIFGKWLMRACLSQKLCKNQDF